jgi:hypothetical protein
MGGGTDYLTLDVWTIGASYRAVRFGRGDRSAVWLQGGLAGANTDDLSVFGVTAGVEIAHDVSRHLGVSGGTRVLMHQHDIHGLEVRAGLAASIVRLSYRVLKLNTGPALRGPEFGLALQF